MTIVCFLLCSHCRREPVSVCIHVSPGPVYISVLPQGYTESPTLFSQALREDLQDVTLAASSTLVQYIDYLFLICSKNLASCQQDTTAVLQALAEKGHKASKAKLQLWS